jgi:hypothetical protein
LPPVFYFFRIFFYRYLATVRTRKPFYGITFQKQATIFVLTISFLSLKNSIKFLEHLVSLLLLAYNDGNKRRTSAVANEKGRKHLPPYVSYRTFRNFIDRLQQRLPSRIDRSYWGDLLSGSTGTQLMAALRFLKLIDANGKPTEQLKPLVTARGAPRAQLLRNVATQAYDFVLDSSLDIESATYAQLEEVFHDAFQLTDDVSRKCVKFFIALSGDAGLPLSPFIIRRTRSVRAVAGAKTLPKKGIGGTKRNALMPQAADEIPDNNSWHSKLLDKFPSFDPSWNDDIKTKWFDAFDELLKRGLTRG